MSIELPGQSSNHEMERNAYNAAFYELGLRWHWDASTYTQLLNRSAVPGERLRWYLESAQAHLLKAYDADFLVNAIEGKKSRYRDGDAASNSLATPHFCNWAAIQAGEIGA